MINYKYCITVLFLLVLGGCTHHYTPDPSTFKLDKTSQFTSTNAIALLNSNTSTEEVIFFQKDNNKFYGDYKKWTDAAIQITEVELVKRGMSVVKNTQAQLRLSIEKVDAHLGWVAKCKVWLKVETGDGYIKTYIGDNTSPATLWRAVDGAVMRAVAEMLRDKSLIAYLVSGRSDVVSKKSSSSIDKDESFNKLTNLKKLLDNGIITEEEFNKKKTEILNKY